MKTLDFKHKEILILVKTYPNPSASYGETVCCAGIDLETFKWIRLYPIGYRDLEYEKRFKKYNIIRAGCAKASDDPRPESYRIKEDSISVLGHIDTKNGGWERRKEIVLRLPTKSLCQLVREEEATHISLGLIKPVDVSFEIHPHALSGSPKRKTAYAQGSFFRKPKDPIEEIPYKFYYQFRCQSESDCKGHKLSILDWEIHEAYRKWRYRYKSEDELMNNIAKQWTSLVDKNKRDIYFFIGNQHLHLKSFIILGIFSLPL